MPFARPAYKVFQRLWRQRTRSDRENCCSSSRVCGQERNTECQKSNVAVTLTYGSLSKRPVIYPEAVAAYDLVTGTRIKAMMKAWSR